MAENLKNIAPKEQEDTEVLSQRETKRLSTLLGNGSMDANKVIDILDSFKALSHNKIAMMILRWAENSGKNNGYFPEHYLGYSLCERLSEFKNLNFSVAEKLSELVPYVYRFIIPEFSAFSITDNERKSLDKQISVEHFEVETFRNDIFSILSKKENQTLFPKTVDAVVNEMGSAVNTDENFAYYFLKNLNNYYTEPWVENILKKAVSHYSVADKFFDELHHSENRPPWSQESWINNIIAEANSTYKSETKKEEIRELEDLVHEGSDGEVMSSLHYFKLLTDSDIANILFKSGRSDLVVESISPSSKEGHYKPDEFKDLNAEVARNIMTQWFPCTIIIKAHKSFKISNSDRNQLDESIAADLSANFNDKFGENILHTVEYINDENIEMFPRSMNILIEKANAKIKKNEDLADYILESLLDEQKGDWKNPHILNLLIKAISHKSVAIKFLAMLHTENPAWSEKEWVKKVSKMAEKSAEDSDDFRGSERFAEHDPYENHQWLFKGEQVKVASIVADMFQGKEVDKDRLEQYLERYDVRYEDIKPDIERVNKKIEGAYQYFLEQIRLNQHIPDEEKKILLDPENSTVRMTNLLTTVRSLVARYLVQEGLSHISDEVENVDALLEEGFKRYLQIHEIDVPLYDKLYAEFDNLREAGRNITEVKLGRDGGYAWEGRRAQDVARRRKMGWKKRKELRAKGEKIEIRPKYLVYPRYFRDNINYETKRAFLEQEGISPDADPLFYDTGYTGTIPEQIMKIMDFDDDDVERRIRLLSAKAVNRRVRGISENARSNIVEHIEHNAKLEESAEGLIIDKKTGKIRHIAAPTSPQEQFYYMMIKQAIGRHYWIKEHLHHTPTEHTNLDSEHHTLRIRDTYKDLLPEEFTADPQNFLNEHGTLLKGSEGAGDYPDEEILSFTLKNGKEVIAKRIELRKAKEARKELAILIGAQKAGLPTAAPVGFLAGKEDTDHSYMLMEKIEGTSGRNFEKKLRETGKYSEEHIQKIMNQIYYKNRKMADLFREKLGIDKRWRIKDTIIDFNKETGEVGEVIPIDWERVEVYDPTNPKEIDGINIV